MTGGPSPAGHDSLADPRRRPELYFVLVLLACLIGIPIVFGKLFPFGWPSFFVAKERRYATIAVFDPAGREIPPHSFGLGDYYWAQNGYFSAVPQQEPGALKLPPTIHIHGDVPTRKEIRQAVREALISSDLQYVTVRRAVKGPVNEFEVGIVDDHTWRIKKPRQREGR